MCTGEEFVTNEPGRVTCEGVMSHIHVHKRVVPRIQMSRVTHVTHPYTQTSRVTHTNETQFAVRTPYSS